VGSPIVGAGAGCLVGNVVGEEGFGDDIAGAGAGAEGLDDAASFGEKLGCAKAKGLGVVKAERIDDATSFGEKLGCSDSLIDCRAGLEGIDDWTLLDDCRVEGLDDDGAGLS